MTCSYKQKSLKCDVIMINENKFHIKDRKIFE